MDEKIIISSESRDVKKIIIRILIYGLIPAIFIPLALTVFGIMWDSDWTLPIAGAIYAIPLIVAFVIWLIGTCSITVTTKRVYGMAKFKRRIDIPIDCVTSIGMIGLLIKGIRVSSASGNISFVFIKNYDEIYTTLGKIIAGRNNNETLVDDSVDDIRKYKQLLDDGIISQEEFDAKKKKILNI